MLSFTKQQSAHLSLNCSFTIHMTTPESRFFTRLNLLIKDHLDEAALSTDSLCSELGVSRSQLHRLLKEQSGLAASRYIRQRRLNRYYDKGVAMGLGSAEERAQKARAIIK